MTIKLKQFDKFVFFNQKAKDKHLMVKIKGNIHFIHHLKLAANIVMIMIMKMNV